MADTLTGKSYVITTTDAAVLTAGGSETITLIGITVANIHATDASWVTARIVRNTGSPVSRLVSQISIPVNDSLDLLQGKVVLNSGDALWLDAQADNTLEATLSYLVQT